MFERKINKELEKHILHLFEYSKEDNKNNGKIYDLPDGACKINPGVIKVMMDRRKLRKNSAVLKITSYTKSDNKIATIYRHLIFCPNIKTNELLIDWVGIISLSAFSNEVDEEEKEGEINYLKIRVANIIEKYLKYGFMHPSPIYSFAFRLSIISIALGIVSFFLGLFSLYKQ